jgi:hypothetical protein
MTIDNADKAEHMLNIIATAADDDDYEFVSVEATRKSDGRTVFLLALAQEKDGHTHILALAEFIDYNDYVSPFGEALQ